MKSAVVNPKTDGPKNMTEMDYKILCKQGGKQYALKIMLIVAGLRKGRKLKATM